MCITGGVRTTNVFFTEKAWWQQKTKLIIYYIVRFVWTMHVHSPISVGKVLWSLVH